MTFTIEGHRICNGCRSGNSNGNRSGNNNGNRSGNRSDNCYGSGHVTAIGKTPKRRFFAPAPQENDEHKHEKGVPGNPRARDTAMTLATRTNIEKQNHDKIQVHQVYQRRRRGIPAYGFALLDVFPSHLIENPRVSRAVHNLPPPRLLRHQLVPWFRHLPTLYHRLPCLYHGTRRRLVRLSPSPENHSTASVAELYVLFSYAAADFLDVLAAPALGRQPLRSPEHLPFHRHSTSQRYVVGDIVTVVGGDTIHRQTTV